MQIIYLRIVNNCYNNFQAQLFAHLLTPFLVVWPCIYLSCVSLVGLTIGLTIDRVVSMTRKVTISLFEWRS